MSKLQDETLDEIYLGDAVYASFDGYHIWLRTGDGNNQQIALDPQVLAALLHYSTSLHTKEPKA